MAKTYSDIVKYMVKAKFDISGTVEKPDIIGAIFGQTEGLLGADLDLRELQKNGKIGRIEIDANNSKGKTAGILILPSSLGRIETCILAAAIESVDRVGPFDTSFSVINVEDTRNEKRNRVIDRAKELVKKMLSTTVPDSKEISDIVEGEVKSSTVILYGDDRLPAGPDINKSENMIIVEGRADVVNLLKNDITNCISIGGASSRVPKSVLELCKQKEVVVFLDGDHGGSMILGGLITAGADIDFVSKAPDGKEVEELTRKEIIKSLRFKIPIDQIIANQKRKEPAHGKWYNNLQYTVKSNDVEPKEKILSPSQIVDRLKGPNNRNRNERMHVEKTYEKGSYGVENIDGSGDEKVEIRTIDFGGSKNDISTNRKGEEKYTEALEELKNTLRGRLYSKSGEMITEIPIRDLIHTIEDTPNLGIVVFDGIITQRLVDVVNKNNIKAVYGIRPSDISRRTGETLLFTSEQGIV